MNSFYKQIKEIRDIINEPREQYLRFSNRKNWSKLCVCLDTLEDTQSAIDYYLQIDDFTPHNGGYLYIYGLLQALFLQQDATIHLSEGIFDLDNEMNNLLNKNPELKKIREACGHIHGHYVRVMPERSIL